MELMFCTYNMARASVPVSYTHLDVYKRQALAYAAYQAEKNLFRPAPKAPVLRVAAKEQTPMRVA